MTAEEDERNVRPIRLSLTRLIASGESATGRSSHA